MAAATSTMTYEDLASRLRTAVTRLNRRLRAESFAGLSPAQASALGVVSRLGAPTLGELAEAEQVQPPTMTRLVAFMEDQGFVVRQVDPTDRRICRVQITVAGSALLEEIRSLKNAYLVERMGALGEDERSLDQLATLLERLVGNP